jgi:DNA recombination protein RmuC
MDATALIIGLAMLAVGAAVGWLAALRRADVAIHSARVSADAATQAARLDAAALRAELEAQRESAERTEDLLRRNDEQLRELFGTQAAEALQRNAEHLLQLARTQLATSTTAASGELARRQQAIETMVAPLQDALAKVHQQLAEVERGRTTSQSALQAQLREMSLSSATLNTQTAQLVTALRAPQTRGRWGEMQLERVVEAAGLTEHVDFSTQVSGEADGGARLRPDMVVHLTGGKVVVVDSKVPFAAYLEAMEATDERTRAERMKAHARHLRTHIDQLAGKDYGQLFETTPEFVVCFVPADTFLDAALREDANLQEHAFAKNVVLATPSTLVALLRTIAYTWRQESLAANAKQVHELGRDLYKRLATMGSHFDKLGRSLKNAVGSYNDAVGSMERMVLPKARQMSDLGVVDPGTSLARLEPLLEAMPRETTAPELATRDTRRESRVISLAAQPELPTGT